jgi:predicted DNA-binding ArsR family transcriptional regulator
MSKKEKLAKTQIEMWQQQWDYFKSKNIIINTIQMNMVQSITNLTQVLGMTFTSKNNLNNSEDLLQTMDQIS